jgi:hypothetical protein
MRLDSAALTLALPAPRIRPMNISELSAVQLRRAASIKERIEQLSKELTSILGTAAPAPVAPKGRKKKRTMSAAARALISAAQKQRWARIKALKKKK